jgi:hypothetical protein
MSERTVLALTLMGLFLTFAPMTATPSAVPQKQATSATTELSFGAGRSAAEL